MEWIQPPKGWRRALRSRNLLIRKAYSDPQTSFSAGMKTMTKQTDTEKSKKTFSISQHRGPINKRFSKPPGILASVPKDSMYGSDRQGATRHRARTCRNRDSKEELLPQPQKERSNLRVP